MNDDLRHHNPLVIQPNRPDAAVISDEAIRKNTPHLWYRMKMLLLEWLKRTIMTLMLAGSLLIRPMMLPPVVYADTITVDGATCTLADAITAANTDTATGGCAAGSGDDVISLGAATYNLSGYLPIIDSNISFEGAGAGSTIIDGGSTRRIFFVKSGTVTFKDMTIQNGKAVGGDGGSGDFGGGAGAGLGGALFVYGGTVTAENVAFNSNNATGGNGGDGTGYGYGGGGGMLGAAGGAGSVTGYSGGGGGFGGDGGAGGSTGGAGSVSPLSSAYGGGGGFDGGSGYGSGGNGDGSDGGFGGGGGGGTYGGDGGFGAGGGGTVGYYGRGGRGGFGGGGGAGPTSDDYGYGGFGGFGGGGGAGGYYSGDGGYGGGDGGRSTPGAGGGGAGFGGAVFAMQGTTTLIDVSFSSNSTTAGLAGGAQAEAGTAAGNDVFICTASQDSDCSAVVNACGTTSTTEVAGGTFGSACPGPDVNITKAVTPAWTVPGAAITYTLSYNNAGNLPATGVVITDSVPISVTNPSVAGSSGAAITPTGTAPNFAWEVADLSPGAGGVITLTGVLSDPLPSGSIVNTAEITTTGDLTPTNNTSSSETIVIVVGECATGCDLCVDTDVADTGHDTAYDCDVGHQCSLRGALRVNESTPNQVICFDLTYPATIPTGDDDYYIDESVTILGPGPKNLTIQGPGDSCSNCDPVFELWELGSTDVVTISGLTITGGYNEEPEDAGGGGIMMYDPDAGATLIVSNTHIISNTSYEDSYGNGGGIGIDDDGTLIVHSSVFSDNYAMGGDGGAIYLYDGKALTITNSYFYNNYTSDYDDEGGGAIGIHYSDASVYITGTTFIGNYSDDDGGAISSDSPLTVINAVITGNEAAGDGGGIATSAPLIVTNSLIDNNKADGTDGGGGIHIDGTTAFITGTTVSNNRATYDDGGGICTAYDDEVVTIVNSSVVDNYAEDAGGGFKLDGCTATITNTLISGNEAVADGGGIQISYGSDVTITGGTLSGNRAGDYGGGIYNDESNSLVISATNFINNTANNYDGGGIYNAADGAGFALYQTNFYSNTAGNKGGGFYNVVDIDLTLSNTNFISNTAGTYSGAFHAGGDVTISDSLFERNVAQTNSNGAFYTYGTVTITNTDFISNSATVDYGAFGADGDIDVSNSLFRGNAAGEQAAAFGSGEPASLTITGTNFISNTSGGTYGGTVSTQEDITVSNSEFTGNQSTGMTGAVAGGGLVSVYNSSFLNNTGANIGAIASDDKVAVSNTLLANNHGAMAVVFGGVSVTLTHTTIVSTTANSDVAVGSLGNVYATNNLIANYGTGISGGTVNEDYTLFAGVTTPVNGGSAGTHSWVGSNFSDAGFVDAAGGDFHLSSSSWAINKGVDAGIATDFDGDARPGGGGYDLGYDETTYTGPTAVDDTATTTVDKAITLSPLTNDTKTDGDALTIGAVGSPAHGTATVISNSTQLVFTPTTGYSGTVVFTYTAREASQLEDTATITVTVDEISDIYFPLIVKNFVIAPDLVITALSGNSGGISLTIKNIGNSTAVNDFWVDVYFDPTATPQLNQRWYDIATAGAAWGVTQNLAPDEELTLTVGDQYYDAAESSGSFPDGAEVYGYVDSINYETAYGNVWESNEANNLWPAAGSAGVQAAGGGSGTSTPGLPQR